MLEQTGKKDSTMLWIAVIGIILLLGVAWVFVTNRNQSEEQTASTITATTSTGETAELQIEDVKVGTGQEAQSGQTLAVHYVGTLEDGTKFDSSRDRGAPFTFTLGAGQVIQGWELGIAGMREGGIRKLVIPPELGYGDRDLGAIPPNSTLYFEVELITVVDVKG